MKEIWKDISGYEGCYQVSNYGRVKSLDRVVERNGFPMNLNGKILKSNQNSRGYLVLGLCVNGKYKTKTVHRLVVEAFLGRKKDEINHKDLNKANNYLTNLEYSTRRANVNHYFSSRDNSSKFNNVHIDKRSSNWCARFMHHNISFNLGLYNTEEEAYLEVQKYEKIIMPLSKEETILYKQEFNKNKKKRLFPKKYGVRILKYSKDGVFIRMFNSRKEAEEKEDDRPQKINDVLEEKYRCTDGFRWKYHPDDLKKHGIELKKKGVI